MGLNTEYCSDLNGSQEYKCDCHDGFDGKRCEVECPVNCENYKICKSEINKTTNIKKYMCVDPDPIDLSVTDLTSMVE